MLKKDVEELRRQREALLKAIKGRKDEIEERKAKCHARRPQKPDTIIKIKRGDLLRVETWIDRLRASKDEAVLRYDEEIKIKAAEANRLQNEIRKYEGGGVKDLDVTPAPAPAKVVKAEKKQVTKTATIRQKKKKE